MGIYRAAEPGYYERPSEDLAKYVRYNKVSLFLSIHFTVLDRRISFVIPRTSLYRSLNSRCTAYRDS